MFNLRKLKRPMELATAACRACEAGGFAQTCALSLGKKTAETPDRVG
jgi:hypothetical protein